MIHDYLWCAIVGGALCFALGFGMGANDVANNFGTSVGSKSISLRKALVIAAIFELIGSVALGASVTDSLRTGVFDAAAFGDMPDFLLVANLTSLAVVTIWLIAASTTGMTVSTTHSLVGSMLGCGLAFGAGAIHWDYMLKVVIVWVLGPLASAALGASFYVCVRRYILRAKDPVKRGLATLWFLLLFLCCTCSFFFIFKNPLTLSNVTCQVTRKSTGGNVFYDQNPCKIKDWATSHAGMAVAITFGAGAGMAVLGGPLLYWWALRRVKRYEAEQKRLQEPAGSGNAENMSNDARRLEEGVPPHRRRMVSTASSSSPHSSNHLEEVAREEELAEGVDALLAEEGDMDEDSSRAGCTTTAKQMWDQAPWNQDLHAEVYEGKPEANELMELAEKFDERCEAFFGALQTMSAAVACMVHGSNDVSNATAPFASVYSIYHDGEYRKSVSVPIWILVLGGAAISIGLMVLGHRVIKRVGIELFYVSASRGFCVEMALSCIMLIASFFGWPVSTTHVGVGAMIGIGMMEKHIDRKTGQDITQRSLWIFNLKAINWKLASKFATAWILTIFICGIASCTIFSFTVFTPTKIGRFTPCMELGTC